MNFVQPSLATPSARRDVAVGPGLLKCHLKGLKRTHTLLKKSKVILVVVMRVHIRSAATLIAFAIEICQDLTFYGQV